MTLYEMLDVTTYKQKVWIFASNVFGQCMPIYKGDVNGARVDTDIIAGTWMHLMRKVEHYEISKSGLLLIFVHNKPYKKRLEDAYNGSYKWGEEKEKRPWRYLTEIYEEVEEPEKKPGRWIKHNDILHEHFPSGERYIGGVVCSKCGFKIYNKMNSQIEDVYKFCPKCGAKMDAKIKENLSETANSSLSISEIVYCKDCKYCTEELNCSEWGFLTDADGFCHYGSKK